MMSQSSISPCTHLTFPPQVSGKLVKLALSGGHVEQAKPLKSKLAMVDVARGMQEGDEEDADGRIIRKADPVILSRTRPGAPLATSSQKIDPPGRRSPPGMVAGPCTYSPTRQCFAAICLTLCGGEIRGGSFERVWLGHVIGTNNYQGEDDRLLGISR